MSRNNPTDNERAELRFPCDRCDALPGAWCLTATTRPTWARWLHQPRWQRVRDIVALSGWERWLIETEGELAAVRRAIRALLNDVRGNYLIRTDPDAIATRLEAALAARGQAA